MINHQMQWDKPHDYCLVSVIDGEGKILIDDKPYDIKKGMHFILTSEDQTITFEGNIELIISHP